MKKFLAFVLVLGLACAGAVTAWASLRAQERHRAWVEALVDEPGVRLLEERYEAGWLQSRGTVSFEVAGLLGEVFRARLVELGREEPRARVGIQVEHRIDHGIVPLWEWAARARAGDPVIARVKTRIELDQEGQAELVPVLGRPPALVIDTDVHLSGATASRFTLPAQPLQPRPPRDAPAAAGGHFRGLTGWLRSGERGSELTGGLELAGFELQTGARNLEVGELEASLELARHAPGVWVGGTEARLSHLASTRLAADGGALLLTKLGLALTARPAGQMLRAELALDVEELELAGETHGPGRAALVARSLDPGALLGLSRAAMARSASALPAGPARALARLATLVTGSPVFELQALELATPAGQLEASARVGFDDGRSSLLASAETAASAVDASLDLRCPAPLLETLLAGRAGPLPELEQRGLVTLEDGRYRARLELRGGQLTVNGVPVALQPAGDAHAGLVEIAPRSARP